MRALPKSLTPFIIALLVSAAVLAAPGQFSPIGPEGYVEGLYDLSFPTADPSYLLARSSQDFWESRDGGQSWRSLWNHMQPRFLDSRRGMPNLRYSVDPHDPRHIFLAGQGWPYETFDGGRTWVERFDLNGFGNSPFFFDRRVPGTVLLPDDDPCCSDSDYWASIDGGRSFIRIPQDNPGLLVDVSDQVARFIKFSQLGTYDLRTQAWRVETVGVSAHALFPDLEHANEIFAVPSDFTQLLRSSDGGKTFSVLLDQLPILECFLQSPTNPEILYVFAGTDQIYSSTDRGVTWNHHQSPYSSCPSVDPQTGDLIYTVVSDGPVRRKSDGSIVGLRSRGVDHGITEVAVGETGDFAVATRGRAFFRPRGGHWIERTRLAPCLSPRELALAPWNDREIFVACDNRFVHRSLDGGWSWSVTEIGVVDFGGLQAKFLFGSSPAESVYLWRSEQRLYRSQDRGVTWNDLGGPRLGGTARHPDSTRGLIAFSSDRSELWRYSQADGWVLGTNYPPDASARATALGHDPRYPDLLYAVIGESVLKSQDFGQTWQLLGIGGPFRPLQTEIAIDPADPKHWLLANGGLFESRDGQRPSLLLQSPASSVAFDPQVPGRVIASRGSGVWERTDELLACPDNVEDWCARGGRFVLTVDWQTATGEKGFARKVVTGSEDSGLFYFFDQNNWELLVKVLDGCALNDRFWVFAAGTTDIEYFLRVEDRLTGQVRGYFNPLGRPAPAVTDTDAFSGCATAAPATASTSIEPAKLAAADSSLDLGRFDVGVQWTDAIGRTGAGIPTPLRSANSGLFWFFDPNNWEVLVKVLDGCAINGHHWVLVAATTDVGYKLEIRDTAGSAIKRYTNEVGQASPAIIDTRAFACPAGG
jgi:photosystem II stability/assembly factor-like uncharacterized protein